MAGSTHEDFRMIRSPFEGKLIRLRAFEEHDIPRVNELVWDPDVSRHLAIAWPDSIAGTHAFWERARANGDGVVLVVDTLAGELIGLCSLEGINPRTRSAALGIWIGRTYWDRGYGTDAVRTLCRYGFAEMNLQRIGLAVYETNPRGVRAYEKIGFKEEGRRRRAHFVDGGYIDVIVMGLLAEELIDS
jgi:RimJ/RimL family protein N-acetyltransferase